MINEIVEDVECKYEIYSSNINEYDEDNKELTGNNLIICFLIKPDRLFHNRREVFWKEIDFKRKICLLLKYKYSFNIDSNIEDEDTKKSIYNVNLLNTTPSINMFQTNECFSDVYIYLYQLIENAKKNGYYTNEGGVYPLCRFLQTLINNPKDINDDDLIIRAKKYLIDFNKFYNVFYYIFRQQNYLDTLI